MTLSELAPDLARLIIVVAAGVVAVPLVRRSSNRRSTCLAIGFGVVLAVVPTGLHLLQLAGKWNPHQQLAVLSRLDAPGFAFILYGIMLSLRTMSRTGDQLQRQNALLKEEASTDFLTGLLNRRQADVLLDYGAACARRSSDPLGFIMIDLDHFKNVNDTFGHQAGDAVLAHVAHLLKARMRSSDIVARYGGEEFLVVLADPSPEGISTLADDLRRLIEQTPAQCGGIAIPVTASFGIAISRVDTEDAAQEGIAKADAALYSAKAEGRNRVVSWAQAVHEGTKERSPEGDVTLLPGRA